jgi:opacity protein-like surface antigen
MRITLSLLFLFISMSALSQTQSVQSTPIAVGADGLAGETGEDEETMKARAELRASKIQKTDLDQSEDEAKAGPELGMPPDGFKPKKKSTPRDWQMRFGRRYLLVKSGLIASQWKKVSPMLKNGSSVLGFGVYQKMGDQMGASASLDFTHGLGGSLVPEETRMFALHLKGDLTHPINQKLQALGSLGLQIADYQLRKKIGATTTTETYQNFGTGTAFGLQASVGMRALFSKDVFVDFSAGYLQFFSSPQKNFGGPLATLSMQLRL